MSTTESSSIAQVIEPQRTEDGVSYALPVDAAAVAKMEAVDLDLLITTTDGQQFILTQAGLLAMTQPDSVIRYAGGQEVLASEEIKQIGALKPMESNSFRLAGSFRLASLELDDDLVDKVNGTGFGLGQDLVDITSKLDQSTQKIEQILKSLEQSTQSAQASAGEDPPPATQTGVKRTSKLADPNPFASPVPGAPPQPENDKTIDKTNDNDALPNVTISLLAANKAGVDYIISKKPDGTPAETNKLAKTEVRHLLGRDTVELSMNDTAKNLVFEAGKIENQLVLKSVPTTTLLVDIYSNGNNFPEGLTINGQAFTPGTPITLEVTGMRDNEVPLNLQWKEGAKAASSDFQMTVAYVGPDGDSRLKIITFTGDTKYAYTLDRFGEPIQFIASQSDNLVVTANDQDNRITLGNGNDTIKGSGGSDIINGGGGKDTMDYSASAAVKVNVATGVVTYGQADGDQLSNIETLKGSANSDTLDFSGATTAVNANFITGTTNQKLKGSDQDLTFSGFENAVGSAYNDVFVANDAYNNFKGGEGSDTVSYAGSDAVEVDLHTGKGIDGHAKGDTYESIENVIGSSGNDIFVASAAANTFTGGGGVDRVSYVHSTEGVKVNLSTEEGSGGFAAGDKYIGIVNVTGSSHDDTFVANNQGNNFVGGDGIDTVNYEESDIGAKGEGVTVNLSDREASYVGHNGAIVKLKASSGTGFHASGDTYASIENVIGSAGNDIFIASSVSNTFDGGVGGSDTVSYAGLNIGIDQPGVKVNLADNKGTFDSKTDTYKSIDNVTGSAGRDELRGNEKDNVLMGGGGADRFFGGGGFDTVSYQDSPTGVSIDVDNTTLGAGRGTGFAKGDVIVDGVERILGSNGNDTFFSTRSDVVLDGGAGFDSIDFSAATNGVTVNLGDTNKFVSIERVVGSNHDDKLTASNSGSTLVARGGNDTLIGGNGVDFLDLVTGNSTPDSNGRDGDEASAGAGSDTVWIDARNLTGNEGKLDGGTAIKRNPQTNADTDTDTLRVIAGATLDLGSLNAVNFERVDLRSDGGATQVSISSADIRALVNSGPGNNVLTLLLDRNDTYTIEAEANVRVTQGQSINFYNTANDDLIAQVNYLYA